MSSPTESPDVDRGKSRATGPPAQAFGDAIRLLRELRTYIGYYVSSRLDQLKLTVRSLVIGVALGVVALIALAAVVVVGVVQVLGGIAGGIGQIFPSHAWIGSLITGVIVLVVVFFGVRWSIGFIGRMSRAAVVAKYEAFKKVQHEQFGRSVDDNPN
jgi:phosphotransferase system  glucose/maltose/N-acetylglucosamine-specific IIC component